MKLKSIGIAAMLAGLCMMSCRGNDETDTISHSATDSYGLSKVIRDSTRQDSLSYDDDNTKDPPKTGQQWKH